MIPHTLPIDQSGQKALRHDTMLLCPYCNDTYIHQENDPIRLEGNDKYDAGWGGRGDVLKVPFWGECGHRFGLCFGFHKGNTYVWAESD